MAEINIQEALSITKKMANHFAAFEKLHEVTQMLASAERVLEERKKAKLALDGQVEHLEGAIRNLHDTFAATKTRLKSEELKMAQELSKVEEGTNKKVFICEERQKQAEELAKTAEERAGALYKEAMEEIEAKTKAAKDEMLKIQARLNSLKKSIGAVGD